MLGDAAKECNWIFCPQFQGTHSLKVFNPVQKILFRKKKFKKILLWRWKRHFQFSSRQGAIYNLHISASRPDRELISSAYILWQSPILHGMIKRSKKLLFGSWTEPLQFHLQCKHGSDIYNLFFPHPDQIETSFFQLGSSISIPFQMAR